MDPHERRLDEVSVSALVLRKPAVTEEQGDGYELWVLLRSGLLSGID
jgi:hypothetical protein